MAFAKRGLKKKDRGVEIQGGIFVKVVIKSPFCRLSAHKGSALLADIGTRLLAHIDTSCTLYSALVLGKNSPSNFSEKAGKNGEIQFLKIWLGL